MKADFVLDYDVITATREQNLYVLARIEAEATGAEKDRRPLNLSLVLDRSGSMQGNKLEYIKQAANYLVQRLSSKDRLNVVSYDHMVKTEIQPGPVMHKDMITQTIQQLQAGGSTNLSGGWLQGCTHIAALMVEGQINRALLLTDGLANQGVVDAAQLETMARQKRAEGITTTTMGVGMDFNEDLLRRMAAEGGGAFYFIDNPDQAPHIFIEELHGLMSVVGQNLVITLMLSPNVKMVRQLNAYPTENKPNGVIFKLGDLFGDEVKQLLLELQIPAMQQLGEIEVARLRFDYDELAADAVIHRTMELPIMVNAVPEADFEGQARNEDVVKTALLLEAARSREEAVKHADRGDFGRASEILRATASRIGSSGLKDENLQRQHTMLYEESASMDFGTEQYDSYTRKATISKSSYTDRLNETGEGDTMSLHARLKQSRRAPERKGKTPTVIVWPEGSLPLGGRDQIRIGRAADNDIVVAEEEVSAHHCEIVRDGKDLFLVDLNSTNGTYANGGQLTGRFRLSVGDVVTVGMQLFRFEGG